MLFREGRTICSLPSALATAVGRAALTSEWRRKVRGVVTGGGSLRTRVGATSVHC